MSAVTGSPTTQAWKMDHFILTFGVVLVYWRCCNKLHSWQNMILEHFSSHFASIVGELNFVILSSSSGHHSRSTCPSFRCSLESLCSRRGLCSQPANHTNKQTNMGIIISTIIMADAPQNGPLNAYFPPI